MNAKNKNKIFRSLIVIVVLLLSLFGRNIISGNSSQTGGSNSQNDAQTSEVTDLTSEQTADTGDISEDGSYTSKEDVALYLHTYDKLPSNFITKKDAKKLGWDSEKGNLEDVAQGMSIGGDKFGNYDKSLPTGVTYHECDIDYTGGYRSANRIIYGDDGSVYYTEDHYETFEKLY